MNVYNPELEALNRERVAKSLQKADLLFGNHWLGGFYEYTGDNFSQTDYTRKPPKEINGPIFFTLKMRISPIINIPAAYTPMPIDDVSIREIESFLRECKECEIGPLVNKEGEKP